jgi:hypothetical protein
MLKGFVVYISLIVLAVLTASTASAQYKVQGHVYDSSRTYPIAGVTIMATNGKLTMTDTSGRYSIDVREQDSVWFSYLGKPTPKYPVLKIADVNQFDLALKMKMNVLPTVTIRARSYIEDSLQNRRDYAKIFDYHRPGLEDMTSIGPTGAGIDLDALIHAFQFKKNRATLRFQQRLEQEERDKFVDRRFNRLLVKNLTGFTEQEVTDFMTQFRPPYEIASGTSDYDFRLFIKMAAEEYRKRRQL